MEELEAALVAYDEAKAALEHHIAMFGYWYQREEPLHYGERQAEEQIRFTRRNLARDMERAREKVIEAARQAVKDK